MRKRLLSASLAVMMICTMLPAALAVDTDTPSTQSETATQAATARIVMDTPAFWDAWNAARDGDTLTSRDQVAGRSISMSRSKSPRTSR